MLSVSEGRQINTTKHFGGGVNVSAGATLLIKGWCSLSHKFIHTTYSRDRSDNVHANTQTRMHEKHTHTHTHTHTL